MSTQGKVVLITGTSSGFGRVAAETLARRGHTVFASMRDASGRNAPKAKELRDLAASEKLKLNVVELDVTDLASIEDAVGEVVQRAGRVDVLVNNAGIAGIGPTEAFTDALARRIFDVNVFGAFNTARAVLPYMREQRRGLIVTVSSAAGRIVFPGFGVYSASKFAIEGLFEALRLEGAAVGVDSVIVEPGAYDTEIFGNILDADDTARARGYEHLATVREDFVNAVREYFKTAESGSPQDVADVIASLIDMEPSMRPTRTLVGADAASVAPLNQQAAQVQRDMLVAFNMAPFADSVR
jgi:NAD(P)-dependent dehydrogenase (short-subunit alcohol dehydrogenase family)